jgi:hypothetical protein
MTVLRRLIEFWCISANGRLSINIMHADASVIVLLCHCILQLQTEVLEARLLLSDQLSETQAVAAGPLSCIMKANMARTVANVVWGHTEAGTRPNSGGSQLFEEISLCTQWPKGIKSVFK